MRRAVHPKALYCPHHMRQCRRAGITEIMMCALHNCDYAAQGMSDALCCPPPLVLCVGEWLTAKEQRMSTEAKTQAHLQKVRGLHCGLLLTPACDSTMCPPHVTQPCVLRM
jgi:hypothetical protein